MDGIADHMKSYPRERTFVPARKEPVDVARALREAEAQILLNYLPVGSEQATRYYAECCLEAGVAMINCMPVFIVSEPAWAARFEERGLPCVGDDVKSQIGATIVHRMLTRLFTERGIRLERTYQLNTGGNTDFLNMLNRDRLESKRISKTDAVQSQLDRPLADENIHIGPSDYVPWQEDNKVCFLRMEGRGFAGAPMDLELRLSVQDSPNSGGVTIDAIRCCRLAMDRGVAGPLESISSYTMKHPPVQYTDAQARDRVERFIQGKIKR
jgi:myo-inositol-1-phosphate synthase